MQAGQSAPATLTHTASASDDEEDNDRQGVSRFTGLGHEFAKIETAVKRRQIIQQRAWSGHAGNSVV
jgi:hypothetical protein